MAETAFEGAYHKRAAKRENESTAKAYRQTEKTSVQGQTAASQTIGRVTHTEEEEAGQKQAYQALFDKLVSNKDSAGGIFDDMKNILLNYASGGSNNSAVLDLLNSRNANAFRNMQNYWSELLSV